MQVKVKFQLLDHGRDLPIPCYQTEGASGMDLFAAVPPDGKLSIQPGDLVPVSTGLVVVVPNGYEAQVRPRSGLARKYGITVLNTPGTIDSDYRGELQVLLMNLGKKVFELERGMRIAQLVISPVIRAEVELVDSVDMTERGPDGFGSTGI